MARPYVPPTQPPYPPAADYELQHVTPIPTGLPTLEPRTSRHSHHSEAKLVPPAMRSLGESGRSGFHPFKFLKICFCSSCKASKWLNLLWPAVPAAFVTHFLYVHSKTPHHHLIDFIVCFVAMLPAANLLGFAGQELAHKLPKVLGMVVEITLGSVVEIVLFITLLAKSGPGHDNIPVIKAAILGSILANLLLCLGLCFFAGGMRRAEQTVDEAVSEVGSNLLLVAGMGLLVPSAFWSTIGKQVDNPKAPGYVLTMSRITAVFLLIAFFIYLWFQMRTHHSIYDDLLHEEQRKDADLHRDLVKERLTLVEAIIAVVIGVTCVSFLAVFLVLEIHPLVKYYHVHDAFVGLIIVPLVEKAAEHLTAVDEAWDNQINLALAHVLGATVQTALFNAPLVVLVGWGLHKGMDLNFEIFMVVLLVLAILVVGNFLRDGKTNYLEGALCVIIYLIIAISTWYIPNPPH